MDFKMVIETMVPATIAGIGVLWRYVMKQQKKMEIKLDSCEEKHESHNAVIIELTREIGDLKEVRGRLDGIEFLANQVLKAVGKTDEPDRSSGVVESGPDSPDDRPRVDGDSEVREGVNKSFP